MGLLPEKEIKRKRARKEGGQYENWTTNLGHTRQPIQEIGFHFFLFIIKNALIAQLFDSMPSTVCDGH